MQGEQKTLSVPEKILITNEQPYTGLLVFLCVFKVFNLIMHYKLCSMN